MCCYGQPKTQRAVPRGTARTLYMVSIGPGKLCPGLFPGDQPGVAPGHDLDIPVIEFVSQIEEGGEDHADDRHQRIDCPEAVQSSSALLNVHGGQLFEALGFHADPTEETQQEQGQGGGDSTGDLI